MDNVQVPQSVLQSRRDGLVGVLRHCNSTLQRCQVARQLISTHGNVHALLQSRCMARTVRLPESAAFTKDSMIGLRFLLNTLQQRATDQRSTVIKVLFAEMQPSGSMERDDRLR